MNSRTYAAIQAKITAIKADPIAWAQADRKQFLTTLGSAALHAAVHTNEQLQEHAASELKRAESLLENASPEPEDTTDWDRLRRANARAHRAIEHDEP